MKQYHLNAIFLMLALFIAGYIVGNELTAPEIPQSSVNAEEVLALSNKIEVDAKELRADTKELRVVTGELKEAYQQ